MPSGTVLLVEDDPVLVRLLMMLMQMWGLEVVHASTSRAALDLVKLRQNEISLVVCDVNLEGESGPTVVAKIRACLPRTRTLYISGFPVENLFDIGLLTRDILRNSDTGFLQKPFLPEKLQEAINGLLAGTAGRAGDVRQTGVLYASAAY